MHRLVIVGIILSLAANGVLGLIVADQSKTLDHLKDEDVAIVEELSGHAATLGTHSRDLASLKTEPKVNIQQLANALSELSGSIDGFDSRIGSVERQLERPLGCRSGDPVFWASFLGDGLTC